MSTLLYRLGAFCARRAWLVLLVWACVVAVVATGWVLLGARTSNDIRLPGTETQAATDFLAREFPPQQNGQSPVVFHAAQGTLLDPAAKRAVEESVRRMKAVPHVSSVTSPFARGARSMLMSEDEKTAIAQVLMDVNGGQVTRELASQVMAAAQPARDAGLQVEAGGVLGIRLSEEKSRRSEMIGLAVGIVILAFTFGALVAAGMPIITAIVALVTGLGLIGLLGHVADIPVVAPTLATMLGLGVGIDYALFIVFRYRDELHGGADVREAVSRAMATSGSAVRVRRRHRHHRAALAARRARAAHRRHGLRLRAGGVRRRADGDHLPAGRARRGRPAHRRRCGCRGGGVRSAPATQTTSGRAGRAP